MRRRVKRTRRRWRTPVLVGLAILLLVVVGEAAHLLLATRQLTDGGAALNNAASVLGKSPSTWTDARIASAARYQAEAQALLEQGRQGYSVDPGLRLATVVPWLGDQADGALHLADAAVAGARSLGDVLAVGRIYVSSKETGEPPGPRLLNLLSKSEQPLADAAARLGPPLEELRRDQQRGLLPPIKHRVDQAVSILGPVHDQAVAGVLASKYAPGALGADHPVTYMLLFENPAELRPGGGLVADAGVVTVDKGTIKSIEIKPDIAYNPYPKKTFAIPYPLERYLVFVEPSALIAEANWDPDFPASAKFSEDIFGAATSRTVDGTVAIDPYAIAAVLAVTGPVTIQPFGEFNADNFFTKLNVIVNVSRDPGAGKAALAPIAEVILGKVLSQPVTQWPKLLTAYAEQAQGRHIQTYFHDPVLAKAAANARFDGSLLAPPGDYLMVVDGNVSGTKGDFYTKKSADLKVEAQADGVAKHELLLTYELPLPVDDVDRALNPHDGSYGDYFRVYLPEDARVSSLHMVLDGKDTGEPIDQVAFAHGKQVVGAFFRLPRGHKMEVRLSYTVDTRAKTSYNLFVQKQPGIPSRPTSVLISYPGGLLKSSSELKQDAAWSVGW